MVGYDTHMDLLRWVVLHFRPHSVLEFGPGIHSTALFCKHCDEVVTVEQQSPDWYDKIRIEFGHKARVLWSPGPEAWLKEGLLGRGYDMVFVDGHQDGRVLAASSAQMVTDLIICHDWECPAYRWDRLALPGFAPLIYTHPSGSQTAAWFRV